MKKSMVVVIAVLMLALLLVGCKQTEGTDEGQQTPEKVTIGGVEDLEGRKIAVQEGTTGDILASDEIKDAKISRFKKAVDAGIELKNGKADAVILDEQPAKKIVENNPELMILKENFVKEDYAIGVRKGETELLDSINKTLERIKEDGTFQTFLDAYIPETGERKALPERTATSYNETIVMGTNAEFEPFEYMEGDQIVGFDVEVAKEIAADLKQNLKIENMNFDSLINALVSGKIDMIIAGMTVTEEREQSIDFSEPYYTSTQVIIIRKESLKQ